MRLTLESQDQYSDRLLLCLVDEMASVANRVKTADSGTEGWQNEFQKWLQTVQAKRTTQLDTVGSESAAVTTKVTRSQKQAKNLKSNAKTKKKKK